ncbi:D-alanyl-D-alanine carboxypeptidase family protein [Perspicuibacillus lycopersici]|nr:D-alanyl-D-alanine carboxypeptidase family protein [Perspicuibacillus lycopersici]
MKRFLIILLVSILIIHMFPKKSFASVSVNSAAAIVMDQKTGRVFFEKNANEPMKIASITKIMTAIIAIESGKLDEEVTISKNAVNTEGSSIYLKEKEKMKLEDLVYGLMLRSGNDAAVAIAEYVGGSVEGFVYLMNEKAAQIGMKNTHFANPHGLDDSDEHYSTAYDMAILTKYAMQNDKYKEIAGTKVHYAPNPSSKWDRKWTNKNRLLTGLYKYSTGGKTGYTKKAHRTLVSTASKDGMDLIAVTLNSPSSGDWNEHIRMFEFVFSDFEYQTILKDGNIEDVKNSIYKNRAYLARAYQYPITDEEKDLFKVEYRLIKPKKNWKKNPENVPEIIGKTEIYFDDKLIQTMPIYYKYEDAETKKSFFDVAKQIFGTIIGVKAND